MTTGSKRLTLGLIVPLIEALALEEQAYSLQANHFSIFVINLSLINYAIYAAK
jgi:hypothetical protein